jgi:hypothetical protein
VLAAAISDGARAGRDVQAALRRMSRICGLRLEAEGAQAAVISGWKLHLERALPSKVDAATPDTISHALPSPWGNASAGPGSPEPMASCGNVCGRAICE